MKVLPRIYYCLQGTSLFFSDLIAIAYGLHDYKYLS